MHAKKIKQLLRRIAKLVRRALQLTPMHQVLRELKKHGVRLGDLDALEVFGGCGDRHTINYASQVRSLEVWEINPVFKNCLEHNLPTAQIKITDSFEEIKRTTKKYNLIVVDNPMSTYGNHCEHFGLFPDIFNIAAPSAILVLNVIPQINRSASKQFPYLFNEEQLVRRKSFYKTNQPENIPLTHMAKMYSCYALENGFNLEWYFSVKRTFVYYLILKLCMHV